MSGVKGNCPYCKKPNDFQEEKALGMLEIGSTYSCDHCGNKFAVKGVSNVTLVKLAPTQGR